MARPKLDFNIPEVPAGPTPEEIAAKKAARKGFLIGAFGKVCAIASLAATAAVYVGGFQIATDVYDNAQNNPHATAEEVLKTGEGSMTWGQEGAAFALSLSAGFAGIALGRKRRDYAPRYSNSGGYGSSFYGGSSYSYSRSNSGFWDGYFMGSLFNGSSSRSSSSSSSSSNNGGAAILAALAIGAIVVAAASSAVVCYKSVRTNFGPEP